MGIYINPGNDGFTAVRASRYVDKSGLIAAVNGTVGTLEKLNLVSRARRFGKSTAADLLAGKRVPVEVLGFNNDPEGFASKDDVLTLLIHYGYLSYDAESETVRIPNEEIRSEFSRVIRKVKNKETLERVRFSDKLIEDTVEMNASAVIKPALIIELKWDDSPESAINQMKKKHYPDALKGFDGPILLVGISYDKEDAEKKHHCVIEEVWEGRQ